MKRLVLIDGKSVFYRGYYAMGALSLADGTPTGGVYGFAAIAMEIVKKLDPTKVVVAWDSKTSVSKRRAIYPDYKAGRIKPGEDFYAQIPLLEELIKGLGWNFVEIDNYEADDIIGSLSKQADDTLDEKGNCDYETYIISSDLDMLQIVDENTHMWRILKGFSNIEKIDVAEIEAKYGIKKSQFLDLKSLKGDSSDNIPGVPGIGEKTAAKLLNDFGSLENIYENLDQISGSTRTKLEAGKDSAYMSKILAKIMFDAPVALDKLPDFVFDREKTVQALKKLEFNSLIRKFQGLEAISSRNAPSLPSLRGSVAPCFPRRKTCSSKILLSSPSDYLDDNQKTGRVTDLEGDPQNVCVSKILGEESPAGPAPCIIDYDIKSLMHNDEKIAKKILEENTLYWDLSQASFLLNPLARENPTLFSPEDLYKEQKANLEKIPELYNIYINFDLPLIPILYKMEQKGMLIDRPYFENLKTKYTAEVKKLEQAVCALAGKNFNVNSPIQLSEILFTDLNLPTKGIKKTSRGFSTGAKELDKLKNLHPIIPKFIEYRESAKLLSTYILPIPDLADDNNRIHTTFTQNVTATGRLSSKDPNLQNIPVRTEEGKRIRTGFIAPEGRVLVSADYSQFELRLAAVLAGDKPLIDDFNAGVDIHTKTASEAFKVPMNKVTKDQRRAAKVINFGILYGMSVRGLSEAAKMPFAEAKAFIDNYFELRAPIKTYLNNILNQANEKGYVETFFGRRRPTPDVKSPNFVIREAARRAAENMPIQGTEADLMKRAMINVDKKLPKGADLIMQIHDSLIVECDKKDADSIANLLKSEMESVAPELPIKLAVEISVGDNWGCL